MTSKLITSSLITLLCSSSAFAQSAQPSVTVTEKSSIVWEKPDDLIANLSSAEIETLRPKSNAGYLTTKNQAASIEMFKKVVHLINTQTRCRARHYIGTDMESTDPDRRLDVRTTGADAVTVYRETPSAKDAAAGILKYVFYRSVNYLTDIAVEWRLDVTIEKDKASMIKIQRKNYRDSNFAARNEAQGILKKSGTTTLTNIETFLFERSTLTLATQNPVIEDQRIIAASKLPEKWGETLGNGELKFECPGN